MSSYRPDPETLFARLDDGRWCAWSPWDGWEGDPDMIAAAKAVAALWPHLPERVRVARGLFGASVDGVADQATWIAAQL